MSDVTNSVTEERNNVLLHVSYESTRRQQASTDRTARAFGATGSSACPAGNIAADVAFLDSRKTVVADSFDTTGRHITARVVSSN